MKRGHIPVRTCVVCGAKKPRASLLRTALDTREMMIVLDGRKSMKGRGAYVCFECLPRLRFDKRAQRAFRGRAMGLSEEIRQRPSGTQDVQPIGKTRTTARRSPARGDASTQGG